jgi:hypothetical protein
VVVATSTAVIFPNFDPETLEHDIGLIKLHMEITLTGTKELKKIIYCPFFGMSGPV